MLVDVEKMSPVSTSGPLWYGSSARTTRFMASTSMDSASTGVGTVMGCSRRLKELNPDVEVIAVEPHLGHKIQGLKSLKEAYVPGIFDKRLVDQKVNVADEDAFEMARRVAKVEGMLVGMSSGAVVFAALELSKGLWQADARVGEREGGTP